MSLCLISSLIKLSFSNICFCYLQLQCSHFTMSEDIEQFDFLSLHQGEHFHVMVRSCLHLCLEEGHPPDR